MDNQLNIFEVMYQKYKINKPIRLIELFAGYGSQALALKYLGVSFEHWKICEWAVKSIQAYKDIHFTDVNEDWNKNFKVEDIREHLYNLGISSNYNEPMTKKQIDRLSEKQVRQIHNNICNTNNLVNIQQVKGKDLEIEDTDEYDYILTYSFPCQDLSNAGKKAGFNDTSTRSGMLWEVERILSECKEQGNLPQILLMENVIQLHSLGENMNNFYKWQLKLEELGYKNYWQDLIATDYGIPQTRNRCFMVSILGDYSYTFPKPIPLKLKLKDMLEDNVDEKYYLSDKMINCFLSESENSKFPRKERFLQTLKTTNEDGIAATLCTTGGTRCTDNFIKIKVEDKYYLSNKMIDYITSKNDKYKVNENKLVINRDIACSKTTREGNTRADTSDYICREMPENTNILKIKNATKKENIIGTYQYSKSDNFMKGKDRLQLGKDTSDTLQTTPKEGLVNNDLKIRKLTPRECFRLMGVKDEDFDKVRKNQSDSSLYHLAGDSIVCQCLMAIFKEMIK